MTVESGTLRGKARVPKRVKGTAFDCLAWSNLKEEGDALICSRHSSVNTISHRVEIGVGSGNSNLKASQDHSTLT